MYYNNASPSSYIGSSTILEAEFARTDSCADDGLEDIIHTLTGKSVQNGFHSHFLVDKCLNHMMVSEMADDSPTFSGMVEELLYTLRY